MKLMPFTVWIIGICIAFVVLSVGYFQFYAPKTTEARYQDELADKLAAEGAKLPAQKRKVEEAIALRQSAVNEWQTVVNQKTPPTSKRAGGIDLTVNRYQLVVDSIYFRNAIQKAVNRQMRVGGVKVLSAPTVPEFPDNPATIIEEGFGYPKYSYPVRIFDFGRVTVQGTYAQIRENVEGWSRIPNFLAVTDALTIQGTSPTLTGSYTLSMVMYVRSGEIFPPAPTGAANPQNPGGGGGGGGQSPLGF